MLKTKMLTIPSIYGIPLAMGKTGNRRRPRRIIAVYEDVFETFMSVKPKGLSSGDFLQALLILQQMYIKSVKSKSEEEKCDIPRSPYSPFCMPGDPGYIVTEENKGLIASSDSKEILLKLLIEPGPAPKGRPKGAKNIILEENIKV